MEIRQVLEALRNADAAGDEEAARRLAQIAREMTGGAKTAERKPKEGLAAAVMKGLESYTSQARTALSGATEESARAGIARGEKISSEYAAQADPEQIIKAYEEKGLLPAVGTAAKMVPYAVAEQAPNLASSIAGAQLGQKLGTPFGGVGRLAGAGLGALAGRFAASYLPQAGGNIEEQAQAQIERGEPVNISALKAYGTAVPQAAIDTATQGLLVGGKGILAKLLGTTETTLARKSAAEIEKLAQEKLFTTLAKGTAVGAVAEIPGEVLQDMLTRAQAGEEITSPEALKGYGRTALGTALLAPLGGAARLSERAGARGEIEQKQEIARQEEQMRQLKEQETLEQKAAQDKELAKQQAEATKQQAIAAKAEEKRLAQARKLGTPELLARMGDETIVDYDNKGVSKYSLLPDAQRARTEQLNNIAKQLGYTDDEISGQTPEGLQSMLRERATTDLEQARRVIPDLQKQLQDVRAKQDMQRALDKARASGDFAKAEALSAQLEKLQNTPAGFDRIISLSKQLEKMVPAEESLKSTLKQLDKLTPAEADLGAVRKALDKALDDGDFAKAQKLAAQLEKLETTQVGLERKLPGGAMPRNVRALPTEQVDMFGADFQAELDQRDRQQAQQDIEQITEKQPESQVSRDEDLFTAEQEYEESIKAREEGKKKTLTPEEYADSLSRGIDPDFVGPEAQAGKAAPKVLYREVPKERAPTDVRTLLSTPAAGKLPTGPTVRIPYIVDEKGVSRDLTEKEAKDLLEQEPKVAKTGVDEAIDSGIINSEVKDILGLKGLSNRKLDLNVIEDAEFVEGKLRAKLDASKQKAQELLDQYMADPFAENNLYDTEGNLSEKAKEILWRDMQAQELERLLKHIEEGKRGRRTAAGEERLAEKVIAAPERKATIDTTLTPIEKMETKDANELAQVMGVSGAAELKTLDNEAVSSQRHTLEAKRQKKNKDEAYDKLLEALEGQRTSKDAPHKYDLKYLSKLRTQYVQAALKEAAHLRAAQRQSPLSSAQILQATNDMYGSLKELSTRYVAKPVKETVVTRVNKLEKMQEQLAKISKQDWVDSPALTAKRDALIADINKLVESQQKPIRNKIKAKQQESVRLRDQMERYRNSELEPARQKWLGMPEGPVGSQAYIARDQMQQRYLLRKKKFDGFAEHDSRVTQDITDLMKRLDEPRLTRGKKEKDVRPASQRPFADRKKAVETIKEQLETAEAALLAKPERKRVEVSEIERRQGLLAQIKEKQDQLDALKNQQGEQENREKLAKEIAALKARYKKQETELATRQKAPEIPTNFKERRDEAAELETQIKEAFAAKDYDKTAKLLARMQQLDLGEDLASELGTDLEYNQRVLERAIKDTQGELDALVNIPPGKEVKVGQKVPRRGLSEEQQQQLKQLNKRMEALQKSLAQNQASLDDLGLFAAKGVDTTTEDLFAPTAEQGVIFETPEQFLGSSKYGKIAKLRKEANRLTSIMPVRFEDLQKARTDYVTALGALENLRKRPESTQFNYYGELSGQYKFQADKMREKAFETRAEYLSSKNELLELKANLYKAESKRLQERADFYEKLSTEAKLFDIGKYSEDLQPLVLEAKALGLNIENESREIGLSMAQKNVDRLKAAMTDMDELARKNGTTEPIVKEKPADIPKGNEFQARLGAVNTQIAALRKLTKGEATFELQSLESYRTALLTEQFMRTAEGRLVQLRESFMEEYSTDVNPAEPFKTALGRARERAQELEAEQTQEKADLIESLRESRGEVFDAINRMSGKAAAPTNKQAFLDFNMDLYELREQLASIDENIKAAESKVIEVTEAEIEMFRRADSALQDAWAKLKAAEKALTYKDEKKSIDLAKRRSALILSQQAVDNAKEAARLSTKAQQERIQTGAGTSGTKVTRVKALSEEGRKAAYASGRFGESREVQTMNAGWTVEYTADGPVFNYNPKDDPEATDADKKRKNVTAKKAYDSLKKARKAYRNALTTLDQRRIDVAKEKLDAQELFMEDLAGARFVSVKEVVGSTPTELDTKWQVSQEINRLPKKDIKTYTDARAEQEKLRKEIEHVRTLKGQTEISQQRTAVRNAQNQYDKIAYELSEVKRKQEYDISTLSESAYDRRVKDLTQQLDKTKARLAELSTRLKPMEVKNEERLADLTKRYFAAKKIADEILLGKPETDTKGATRAPIAENVKDMKGAMRTLARDEKNSDIKPLIKQNQKLKTASTEEQRVRRAAEGFAKKDRLVTMYSKGSPEYNKALKEVTGGYVKRLIDSTDDTDGTVFRVEAEPVLNPIAEAEGKAVADKFASKLPKDVKFIYAPTLSQAPVKYLKALSNAGVNVETSSVKGGVLPDGTIVVIGDQHTDALDLEKTLIHEAVGHYGVDVVLGPQGMMDLTKAIRTTEGGIFGMAKALGVEEDVLASATAWEQRAVEAEQKGEVEVAQKIRRMGEIQSVREMLAHMQEATVNETFVQKAGRYIKVVLGALRQWLRSMGMPGLSQVSTNELYYTMFQATKRMQQEFAGTYESPTGLISLRTNYATPELAAAGAIVDKVVAKDKNLYDKIKANGSGLAFETQMVDRFAGFERLSKGMEKLKGTQMLYYLRMYDQRMNFVAQSVGNGALQRTEKIRADGRKEYIIESVKGPSIRSVAEILKRASPLVGSPDGASRLFTLYLAGIRAQNKGLETLGFNGKITQAELDSANRAINNTPGLKDLFETARAEYNAYNEGLVRFAAQTHALPRAVVEKLLASKDYIPYYRQRNGVVELLIGGENPVKIGSIKEQPYLQELVGGDEPILDFMTSAVQNTNLLTDMALRNQATSNAVFELVDLGLATITRKPISGTNVVRFKVEPDPKNEKDKDTGDRYALIATDKAGVPADVLVKGMEGIPSQMPFALRAMAAPATFLRKAVTASPLYAARQLFRDSLAAPLLTGADFFPVTGALKEIGSATKGTLESRGITGGQVFTGGSEDLTKILRDITAGRGVFSELLSRAEAISMEADALTRRAQYNSYIKQGLSEMEATYMALESMNFNKRGASPSIHWANSLIPFFNAQIQSLNVLYKAMTGNLPFNERLKIQEKLLTRGLMIAAGTLAYAASMQDDEAYKNATPDQKYGNWFVRIPGVEEPLRIPIPFEIGYIFKALPEALYNSMMNEHGSEEAVKAFNQILIQTIPGGTSMATIDVGGFKVPTLLPIPQAMKPIIETSLGKSFYTGRDILSKGEQQLLPEAQFRENTTEIAKAYGSLVGASPVKVEEFIKGYTGTMGLAFLQVVSSPFSSEGSPEKTYKRLSERAVIGGAFQPNDAGEIINSTFERMNKFAKVKQTVDDYIERGEKSKALELIETRGREYMLGEISGDFTKQIGELTQYERAVRASDLTPEEKRERLAEIRQMKIKLSSMVRAAVDRTEPQ
jgi:hypothetical protein